MGSAPGRQLAKLEHRLLSRELDRRLPFLRIKDLNVFTDSHSDEYHPGSEHGARCFSNTLVRNLEESHPHGLHGRFKRLLLPLQHGLPRRVRRVQSCIACCTDFCFNVVDLPKGRGRVFVFRIWRSLDLGIRDDAELRNKLQSNDVEGQGVWESTCTKPRTFLGPTTGLSFASFERALTTDTPEGFDNKPTLGFVVLEAFPTRLRSRGAGSDTGS
jgi:hypothetical protein